MEICPRLVQSPLTDRCAPPVFGPTAPKGRAAHSVYVDNLGAASTSEPLVADAVEQLVQGFDVQGLLLHGSSVSAEAEALGAAVPGSCWKTR
eukprot:457407-Pyramimonas_sp.AAC.1